MNELVRSIGVLLWVGIFLLGSSFQALAQEVTLNDLLKRVEAVEKKNADLQQENASLKAEIQDIKNNQLQAQGSQAVVTAKTAPVTALVPAPFPYPAAGVNPITSKLKLNVSGFIRVENVYSTSSAASAGTTQISNVVSYVAPHGTIGKAQKNDTISAQNSTFNLNITGPDIPGGGKTSGMVQVNFNNPVGVSSSETYQPRLRLAYASIDYDKWGVTAGQNWDFFAPLKADTINFSLMWRSGDFGFYHPEVYLTNDWGSILGGKVKTQVGIIDSNNIYQDNSGAPVAGAYVSYTTKIAGKDTIIGAGGIYGTSSTSTLNAAGNNNNDIYAGTVNAQVKLTHWLSLKGQGFMGGNLANFMAGPYNTSIPGITNPVNPQFSKPLQSMGGFAEFTIQPLNKLQINLGAGLDDTINRDSVIASTADLAVMWSTNKSYFANVKYYLTKDLTLGMEYQYLRTSYLDGVIGTDNRLNTCLTYNF